jgi:hypothetical protein
MNRFKPSDLLSRIYIRFFIKKYNLYKILTFSYTYGNIIRKKIRKNNRTC